jgi:hypothetical protein
MKFSDWNCTRTWRLEVDIGVEGEVNEERRGIFAPEKGQQIPEANEIPRVS